MTNQEALKLVNNKLDGNKLGLKQHFDLIFKVLPELNYMNKYQPNDEYAIPPDPEDLERENELAEQELAEEEEFEEEYPDDDPDENDNL